MGKVEVEKIKSYLRENLVSHMKQPLIIGFAIVLIIISFIIGKQTTTVAIDNEKVRYDELLEKVESKEKSLSTYQDNLEQLNDNLTKETDKYNDLRKIVETNEAIVAEINEYKSSKEIKDQEISTLDTKITTLNTDIEAKKAELASISEAVIKQKAAPIQLSAGQYIVGQDIPAGRYKAVPVGRGSNLFVYDTSGSSVVNTILGNSDISTPEYVFYALDNYIIETRAATQFIPVE